MMLKTPHMSDGKGPIPPTVRSAANLTTGRRSLVDVVVSMILKIRRSGGEVV